MPTLLPQCLQRKYGKRIHVDSPRIIPNYITNMGATILLDDFTEENGATWFFACFNSQTLKNKPDENEFYDDAKRLIEKAEASGFLMLGLWHAGGINKTKKWRHALTLNLVRPWMKQRINIPKAMEKMNTDLISEKAKQN